MRRSIGLLGATGVGIGAIVGGGILALAGVAFAATGPGAILAFALNGVIAVLTALSFAEMSTAFPESGGTYTFAKKVLSVQAAFTVGWIVWFASIVAGVLYAMGFASYAVIALGSVWSATAGTPPQWLAQRSVVVGLAIAATAFYTASLTRSGGGGGQWTTVGKVIVFAVLIAGGLWALGGLPSGGVRAGLTPFFPSGAGGMFRAMGYTFIALQGFDLIAAVAGEIRDPGRTIPRAMLLSLAAALAIYLPLLLVVAVFGSQPGHSIAAIGAEQPEAVVALAARKFLGPLGFWLVVVAAVLSMLSALQANLFAASRVAFAMARDRTLPHALGEIDEKRSTPVAAVIASALTVVVILLVIPDVAAAGAAASLIFLVSFAMAHWTSILARRRGGGRPGSLRTPWFPLIPAIGGVACLGLAIFQGISVPSAGLVASVWVGLGAILFLWLLAPRARIVDAAAEGMDPHLIRLRGRNPLVLAPIANPASAEAMVAVANAICPPAVGRVVLLSVVPAPDTWQPGETPHQLSDAQAVLGQALTASFAAGLAPEALTTVAPQAWTEISRVARLHRCESLLLGLSSMTDGTVNQGLETLMSGVDCDVVVLRAPQGWHPSQASKILVPMAGRGDHDMLRARLLGSLCRTGEHEVTFVRVLADNASAAAFEEARRALARIAGDEAPGLSRIEIVRSAAVAAEITRRAAESDLVILGLQRFHRRRKVFGDTALRIARETQCAIIMISRRG